MGLTVSRLIMRCITYAGDSVLTTDDVAGVLIELAAALADRGKARAVQIPTVQDESSTSSTAWMVLSSGIGMLSVDHEWAWEEPDFGFSARQLQHILDELTPRAVFAEPEDVDVCFFDFFDDPRRE